MNTTAANLWEKALDQAAADHNAWMTARAVSQKPAPTTASLDETLDAALAEAVKAINAQRSGGRS